MPWTIAHAAAVLPVRKYCRNTLSFAGLVVGSFVPDTNLYLPQLNFWEEAHTIAGVLKYGIPVGFAFILLIRLFYHPVCFLLPQPHRAAIVSLGPPLDRLSLRTIITLIVSLLIGALTHLAWDSFTHYNGFIVMEFPVFQTYLFQINNHGFYVFNVLQHLSSVIGSLILAYCYSCYLMRMRVSSDPLGQDDFVRYMFFLFLAAAAVAYGVSSAYTEAMVEGLGVNIYLFVTRSVVHSTTAFIALVLTAAIGLMLHPNTRRALA